MNSKSSTLRLMVVDSCLRSKQRHTLKDVMNAVNRELEARGERAIVSKHTILDDFDVIANLWHIVVLKEKVGRYVYYRYEDQDFTIFKQPLNEEEITILRSTLLMLKRFEWIPTFEWVNNLIERCEEHFKAPQDEAAFISLEDNQYIQGLHHLQTIYDAIVNKKVLDIWYHSFKYPTAQKNTVHPYFLKQFNNRWFMFCYNEYRQEISNYPLDRIEKIEVNTLHYKDNTFCDFNTYFEDLVGVSRNKDEESQEVLLWISAKQWPYFETKPMHGSQKVIERREDGSAVIQIDVVINWELEQTIFSQGEHIVVLSPDSLRSKMSQRIENLLSEYNS